MNRGRFSACQSSSDRFVASMRPRFMNRGSTYKQVRYALHLLASMRPRFMNRGSGGRMAATIHARLWLQ